MATSRLTREVFKASYPKDKPFGIRLGARCARGDGFRGGYWINVLGHHLGEGDISNELAAWMACEIQPEDGPFIIVPAVDVVEFPDLRLYEVGSDDLSMDVLLEGGNFVLIVPNHIYWVHVNETDGEPIKLGNGLKCESLTRSSAAALIEAAAAQAQF